MKGVWDAVGGERVLEGRELLATDVERREGLLGGVVSD